MKNTMIIMLILVVSMLVMGMEGQSELRFVTEEYPPITFMDRSGEVTGLATEIVKEIMNRQTIDAPMEIMTWETAYQIALAKPNIVIFSIRRTAERETLFHWVGPIGQADTLFYVKKDSGVTLRSLDDAKQLEKMCSR